MEVLKAEHISKDFDEKPVLREKYCKGRLVEVQITG